MRALRENVMEIAAGSASALFIFFTLKGYNLWPALFFGGLLYVLVRATGVKTVSRRFARELGVQAKRPDAAGNLIGFDKIGGQETAKKELLEALEFIRFAERIKRLGIRPIKGILLAGPPGTGKTLLARAAAQYTDSAFIATSGSEFVEVYAGVGAQRVRELFDQAERQAKKLGKRSAIIFIDELEVLGGIRGRHESHLEYDQTINQLLVKMDGLSFDQETQVLVIGATNRPDLLDPALLRPGRFDRVVRVDLPDKRGRLEILKIHVANKPLASDVNLEEIARETFGFSGAHLESLCNEAAILAMRDNSQEVHQRHFREAVDKVILGERIDRKPSAEELQRVAIHEAGHAVVTELLRPGSVSMVTVVPRGNALGYVRQQPEDDTYLYPRSVLENEVAVLLAGSVAEQMFFAEKSTGSINDFNQAVQVCRRIVFSGMSALGIVDRDSIGSDAVGRAVHDILKTQEQKVVRLLLPRLTVVSRLAQYLVDKERVSGDELRELLRRPANVKKWRTISRLRARSRHLAQTGA
ncbi:MAG TPA: AAA family ATPase [Firmicutes bacterium]|nr:AAA family ATPase [Bacillota bacterium]